MTAGPWLTSTTLAVIPKESSVFSIMLAFALMSPLSALPIFSADSKESGGGCQMTEEGEDDGGRVSLVVLSPDLGRISSVFFS